MALLSYSDEIVLLNQDCNLRHFTLLFWNNDIPLIDDNLAGENARYMGFSQLYFAIPLLCYKIGIPLFVFEWSHILFDIPSLLVGLYTLSYVMTRKTAMSVFASFFTFYCLSDLWSGFGYPLEMKNILYYSDFALVPISFFLAVLCSGRIVLSGAFAALTVLFHPTLGVNCCILLFMRTALGCLYYKEEKLKAIISLGIAGTACLIAAFFVSWSFSPEHIDPEIRNILIASYGHLIPQINGRFFYRLAFLVLLVLAGIVMFRRKINFIQNAPESTFLTTKSLLAASIIQPIGVYAFTIVFLPTIYIMLSPSRFWMLPLIFVSVFIGQAVYKLIEKMGTLPILAFLSLSLWSIKIPPCYIFLKYSQYFCFAILLGIALHSLNKEKLFAFYYNFRNKKLSHYDLLLLGGGLLLADLAVYYWRQAHYFAVIAALLLAEHLIYEWFNSDFFMKSARALAIMLLFVMIGLNSFVVLNNPMLEIKHYEYDICKQINEKLPENAILAPYRSTVFSSNPLLNYYPCALRTYSRRGAIYYWQIGYNAFFNSKMRYDIEDRCFKAAGVDVFGTLIGKSRKLRKENILGYYFGSENESDLTHSENVRDILLSSMSEFKNKIKNMSLDEFMNYASKIKVTHLIIPYDAGKLPPDIKPLCMNKYFYVIEVCRSTGVGVQDIENRDSN